ALPAPTQILMRASDILVTHWMPILAGTINAVTLLVLYFRSRTGSRVWHFLQLHAPLLGKLYRKLHLSRGLRMVGTMAGAGVALMDCVTTAHDLCDNSYFRDLWKSVGDQIQ